MKHKTISYFAMFLTLCLFLSGCRTKPVVDDHGHPSHDTSVTALTESVVYTEPGAIEPTVPEVLNFNYGRLTMDNRFIKMSSNGIDFTLNFDKRIYAPGDDIVLTAYVANYTGDELLFSLSEPIVSRQQLIHASLTYGARNQYAVPVTVEFKEEKDLAGGKFDVTVRNRKLIATTITFHTSAYENIEESIFSESFANTYQMSFWFGENEYEYIAKAELAYAQIGWSDPRVLQTLVFSDEYVSTVGNVRFTVSFDQTVCGTDDDIRIHVKVSNLDREPLALYSASDVSSPIYYIRASLTYGNQNVVRDTVAAASEIAGIESNHLLKYQEELERDITFYTSEFTSIQRSVYHYSNRDRCVLKIWLMTKDGTYEIKIPIMYQNYENYTYHDRVVPAITELKPELTTVATTTTAKPETEPIPAETTVVP